jgi:uncharacterized protein
VSAAGRRGFRIGLIADTHGLLRPAALDALSGCDRILHGGDIGGAGILAELKRIAPLTAVRGNNDREPWAAQLPERTVVRVGALAILLLHDAATLGAAVPDVQVVVCGHSHRPSVAAATACCSSTRAAPVRAGSGCRCRWRSCGSKPGGHRRG